MPVFEPLPVFESVPAAPVALTQFSRGAGCGCKLSSAELRATLDAMTVALPTNANVLVGAGTSDDAGVVRIAPDLALVQTLDFFTPIVDDARTWGAIAATNALSDVYAMGGRPITAMNIVAWPRHALPWELLAQVLDGAAEVIASADCALVGGHSIDDAEPKFGCSITGLVHPDRMLTNAAGRAGDVLVLTKPLGVGILTTAVKRGLADRSVEALAVRWMTTLNRRASEAAVAAGVRCATDVTGFGFIGHLGEILRASDVDAVIDLGAVPVLDGVRSLVGAGAVPGGTQRNLDDTSMVAWADVSAVDQIVLCDAQTSGGLLLSAPPDVVATMIVALTSDALANHEPAPQAWVVGSLVERPAGRPGSTASGSVAPGPTTNGGTPNGGAFPRVRFR